MENTYAYLAGVIDSDGYITVSRKRSSYVKKDGTRSLYYEVRVGLGQTNEIIPDLFNSVFPGYRGSHQPKNPMHKKWFIWQAFNEKAREPLVRMLPYLRLKIVQAEACLRLLDMMDEQNIGRFMAISLTEEQVADRHAIYSQVTQLNSPRNRRVHLSETA
jgi:hypothetical protein